MFEADPEGWRRGKLLDFFQLQRGFDLPVQSRANGDVPIIASNGRVGFHNRTPITAPAVVTGRSGTIGSVMYSEGQCWPLNTTLFVSDFKGADPLFVYYFLQSFPLKDHASGTGVPTLNRNDVHAVEVSFPPVEEQKRIVEMLRSVDEAIAAGRAAVDQAKGARAHQLDTLMALPGPVRAVEDICRLSGGFGFPTRFQGKRQGAYPFAKVSDMNRPGNEVELVGAENYVDEGDLRLLKAKPFPAGTTLFPKVGAALLTNKRRIAARDVIVDNNVMGAVASGVEPWFLFYAFNTIDMADYVQPGAVPSINQRTIGKITLPVPTTDVQREFVGTMRDMDRAIETQLAALTRLVTVKRAIAAGLLSGRVRVPA
jgi:type I restriction enzyme, S subunit